MRQSIMPSVLHRCIAKGCALQAAMLSPAFKVRDFQVNDITIYPIALSWTSSGNASVESMEVEGESDVAPAKPGASSTVSCLAVVSHISCCPSEDA